MNLRPSFTVLRCAPLLYLWFRLISNLQVEWETNPQYSYGYIVPLLCLGLILQRGKMKREQTASVVTDLKQLPGVGETSRFLHLMFLSLGFFLAVAYLPTRLIELAVPEWRPIQWALGFITIGITLVAIDLTAGRFWFRQLAFPICFLFVAIPWPTLIEQPVVQALTRINAAAVIEMMGIIGVPAVQHGNVIEVGTGVVGVEEACSGIRSFQSSLMISLFLGALYELTLMRRILFVPIGFLMAMIFNVGRTSFLTWVAAKKGVDAIAQYHDPAGMTILVGCTIGMWVVGMLMKKLWPAGSQSALAETPMTNKGSNSVSRRLAIGLSLALSAWLVVVELGSHFWYRSREASLVTARNWTMVFPEDNASFRKLPMDSKTFNLLRFDDGQQAAWTESDGTQWSGFYFNWQPGRVAGYLAKRHTPEICMPATGREMLRGPELFVVDVHGITLPIRRYLFGPAENPLHVYHCRWESGATRDAFVEQESARYNLIRAVWNGRGSQGQKVIEFVIRGTTDQELAKQSLVQRLEQMIKVEGQTADDLSKRIQSDSHFGVGDQ